MRRVLVAVAWGLALGCGPPPALEEQLTISQGLYGQLRKRCEGTGCVGAPLEGAKVGWFAASPWATDGGVDPPPLQEATSKKNGLYEFSIDSNTKGYVAVGRVEPTTGVRWVTATTATVPRGLARVDWQGALDPAGTWTDVR